MKLRRRVGLLVLMTAASLSLAGATNPLNPLVTRTPQTGPVSAECAEGVAPAPMPRVEVREIPLPLPVETAALPAPATGSLRSALEETQRALTRNDRPAFDASLASARALLEDYPSGAQRRSGEELLRIYDAAARLWDAQYESPFFDEASAEYALVRNHPGYQEAVRRSTLTRDGRRYLPAGESRDFLGRVAAERLRGIGIQAPAPRLARNDRPGVPDAPRATSSAPRPSVTRSRPRRAPATTSARATRPPRSSAPSRPRLTETRTSASASSTPSSPNPSAPPTAAAAPEPAAPAAGTGSSAAAASPAAEGTPTTDAPVSTEPTETADATTTTAPATPTPERAEPGRSRSVVLPTILILIGLGVLILLFRASK